MGAYRCRWQDMERATDIDRPGRGHLRGFRHGEGDRRRDKAPDAVTRVGARFLAPIAMPYSQAKHGV
jgi:hypothetical protein